MSVIGSAQRRGEGPCGCLGGSARWFSAWFRTACPDALVAGSIDDGQVEYVAASMCGRGGVHDGRQVKNLGIGENDWPIAWRSTQVKGRSAISGEGGLDAERRWCVHPLKPNEDVMRDAFGNWVQGHCLPRATNVLGE